jgi:hypothetical protein
MDGEDRVRANNPHTEDSAGREGGASVALRAAAAAVPDRGRRGVCSRRSRFLRRPFSSASSVKLSALGNRWMSALAEM